MSCVGSVISTCTSAATNASDERTLLQNCMYVRDYLKLDWYKSNELIGPHVKISSRTLRECYSLPENGNHIELVFEKLEQFMRYLNDNRLKPPKTDFTCLSRLTRNKVVLDIDCTLCKRGVPNGNRSHFSFTKSLNVIIKTVGELFNRRIVEGVYATSGGRTCGYHIFFNGLAYNDDSGVNEPTLIDMLDKAYRQARLTNAAIDRGCTQMPLPTATHSNSSHYTVPYVIITENGTDWKRKKLKWVEMDAETLKCFSSIAFPSRYERNNCIVDDRSASQLLDIVGVNADLYPEVNIVTKREFDVEKDKDTVMSYVSVNTDICPEVDIVTKRKGGMSEVEKDENTVTSIVGVNTDPEVDIVTKRKGGKSEVEKDENTVTSIVGVNTDLRPDLDIVTKRKRDESEVDKDEDTTTHIVVVNTDLCSEVDVVTKRKKDESEVNNDEDTVKTGPPAAKRICYSQQVAPNKTKIKPFNYRTPGTGGTDNNSPPHATLLDTPDVFAATPPLETLRTTDISLRFEPEQRTNEDDNDDASLFSTYTEATEAKSFLCPNPVQPISELSVLQKSKQQAQTLRTADIFDRLEPEQRTNEDDNDAASLFSNYTEATEAKSFLCPNPVPRTSDASVLFKRKQHGFSCRPTKQDRRSIKTIVYDDGAANNNFGDLPYGCEKDKNSPFADKQYKAALLSAEQDKATASKAHLTRDNREHQRIYILPGSSSNIPREYKLLVQLVNVNRSVYAGDVDEKQQWTDLKVSYYDQHLHNPVILEMIKFIFSDKIMEDVFEKPELVKIKQSFVHVMEYFKQRKEDEMTMSDLLENDDRREREARSHKSRIIGALIRVCTRLFDMVTGVVSDLRKVQQTMERKDLSLLNCTVVNSEVKGCKRETVCQSINDSDDDELDCSASMHGGGRGSDTRSTTKCTTNYTLLASLIVYEQNNVSDQALYAFLYYYHSFPSTTIDRILDEIQHDGLMVTAMIKFFLMYGHRGKTLTLQEIFEGFNDAAIALSGPEKFLEMRRRHQKRGESKSNQSRSTNGGSTARSKSNKNTSSKRRRVISDRENSLDDEDAGEDSVNISKDEAVRLLVCGVSKEEVERLLCGDERKRRRMMCRAYSENCGGNNSTAEERVYYDWKDKHLWQAVINYFLRPVVMHEDRLVFANDGYDTFEDDAVESCVAHVMTKSKNTKADVMTAFKDARTMWHMHHGSHFIYESDLMSETLGCCYHINIALKMYEMFCGGCITRMRRVHKNYLIDRSRFNITVYDIVAECRTATVNLTSAIDRSYMNLLLRQPVVPPFLEGDETRQLFMSETEIQRGSFCCLSVMDYIRAINLFERSNCQSKPELETCEYVETFLDDLYTNEIAADRSPDVAANSRMHLVYIFYSLYIYEVVFAMRHAYVRRENCYISIERLCYELDIRELLILFFGESSMKRVMGLNEDLDHKIRQTAEGLDDANRTSNSKYNIDPAAEDMSSANGRFDVRPVLAVEIPDKIQRMKTLFGQFGFDVMQDGGNGTDTTASGTYPVTSVNIATSAENSLDENSCTGDSQSDRNWEDESKFEQEFYESENWLDTVCQRIQDNTITGKTSKRTPVLSTGTNCEGVFLRETVLSFMRLELKKHIDHDRLGKIITTKKTDGCNSLFVTMRRLPMRLKMLAFVMTTHTIKLKTKRLAADFVEETYREVDGLFAEDRRLYEGTVNGESEEDTFCEPPEKVWFRTNETLLNDRRSLLSHARWLADMRFKNNFFVGLDPACVYNTLYDYMKDNEDRYPAFKRYYNNEYTRPAAMNLCTAMMFILVMSAYDQEHVDLYLKVFLAVEWPGQWAKTIFVWKSNSNAGKSYLFDSIIKRACANSTCINDPKGGKENAPEKAEYVKNFVLFANEFSQANSNELKKIVSESTFKFRMNYGNTMIEAYATGKVMFNCNTLPPTSDEAAINRLTLFNIPFWFCRRQRISDAMLNWTCGLNASANRSRWEMAYRYELPYLLTDAEKHFLKSHSETKNETDLFDGYAAVRSNIFSTEFTKSASSLFLVQNKTSRLYASSSPPTDRIVHGLVNITNHFSWLRFFKQLDSPVDFSTLPASSEAVRSEWLSLTLPYQEWKQLTGARKDMSNRVSAETVNRSLQAFATKKNINYFGLRQFFETDFALSREAIKDEYFMRFDAKVFCD